MGWARPGSAGRDGTRTRTFAGRRATALATQRRRLYGRVKFGLGFDRLGFNALYRFRRLVNLLMDDRCLGRRQFFRCGSGLLGGDDDRCFRRDLLRVGLLLRFGSSSGDIGCLSAATHRCDGWRCGLRERLGISGSCFGLCGRSLGSLFGPRRLGFGRLRGGFGARGPAAARRCCRRVLLLGTRSLLALPTRTQPRHMFVGEDAQVTADRDIHLTKQSNHFVSRYPEFACHVVYAKLAQTCLLSGPCRARFHHTQYTAGQ